jgi:ABC-type proline/glycine betaine transport system substrate-binding protein
MSLAYFYINNIYSIIKLREEIMVKLGLYASMVSVIASVLIYIVLDDSQLAIYVGLWAPTLILYSQAYEQANK